MTVPADCQKGKEKGWLQRPGVGCSKSGMDSVFACRRYGWFHPTSLSWFSLGSLRD